MERISDLEIQAVMGVLKRKPLCLSGFYRDQRGGPSIQAFEKDLAAYIGVKHAICVSNGTTALHTALLACGVGPYDVVLTTPLSFSATATSILMTGAEPIFVDVQPDTYNIDPSAVQNALTVHRNVKAIIPVHLLGTPCDMDPILDATKGDVYVIEDNAQAFGAEYKGRMTGSIGDLSIVSFQETKSMTTGGEGGAIFTDSDRLATKCRYLRNHGSQYGNTDYLTYNYRMTEIQAAFGIAQLSRFPAILKIQRENAKILIDALTDSKRFHPQAVPTGAKPTYYIVGCTVDEEFQRDTFIKLLTEKGINKKLPGDTVGLGYTRSLTEFPLFRQYHRNTCSHAEVLTRWFVWFDVTRWKSSEQVKEIAREIVKCIS